MIQLTHCIWCGKLGGANLLLLMLLLMLLLLLTWLLMLKILFSCH